MKKIYLITIIFISSLLNACGGGAEDTAAEGELLKITQAQSQVGFYLPTWFDHSGEIIIRSQSGEMITSLDTLSLNDELIVIDANQVIAIEYICVEFLAVATHVAPRARY